MKNKSHHNAESCQASISAIRDTLYVLSGKWKLPLIVALSNGPKRFKEIKNALGEITPRVLSKELKELELNDFVNRKVYDDTPAVALYELTAYSESLDPIIDALKNWGLEHKRHITEGSRRAKAAKSMLQAV